MIEKCLFSVIIPIYNTAPFLERCIESVCKQNYADWEMILVDDGSTDGSGEICDRYANTDSRITVIHKENGGLVSARKAGLKKARGQYVSYIDSDDWIESDAFSEISEILEIHSPDLVDCFFMKEYEGVTDIRKTAAPEGILSREEIKWFVKSICEAEPPFLYAINSSLCSKIVHREFLERFQYEVDDQIQLGEDFSVSFRMLKEAERIYFCHKAYYHYCARKESMTYDEASGNYNAYKRLCHFMINSLSGEELVFREYLTYRLFDLLLDYLLAVPDSYFYKRECFPFFRNVSRGDRVIIYGKGLHARNIIKVATRNYFFEVIANVDSADVKKYTELLISDQYDALLIAIGDHGIAGRVKSLLLSDGVPINKIRTIDRGFLREENLPEDIRTFYES